MLGDGLLERGVDDARLHDGTEVLGVDLDDLVHAGQGDRQAAFDAARAAGQAGARTAGHDRDPELGGELHQPAHLFGAAGQGDGEGQSGVQVGRLVPAVRLAVHGVGQEAQVRQDVANRLEERSAADRVAGGLRDRARMTRDGVRGGRVGIHGESVGPAGNAR